MVHRFAHLVQLAAVWASESHQKIFTDKEATKTCKGHFQGAPGFIHVGGSTYHVVTVCGNPHRLDHSANQTGDLGDKIKGAICVMKTSTNDGKDWGDFRTVSPKGMTEIGACKAMWDAEHKRILVQYYHCPSGDQSDKKGLKFYQITSDGNGKTWSKPKDITKMLTEGECPEMPGTVAGNRIQLRDTNRLLWGGESGEKPCFWHSDDGGETYQTTWVNNVRQPNEYSLVQIKDGSIYMNGRSTPACEGNARDEYWSHDHGKTWKGPACSSLKDALNAHGHGSEASMIYHGGGSDGSIFFLNPSSQGTTRSNMKVHCSVDGGKSWPYSYAVKSTSDGGYSDLIMTNSHKKLMLGFTTLASTNIWAIHIDWDWCKQTVVV